MVTAFLILLGFSMIISGTPPSFSQTVDNPQLFTPVVIGATSNIQIPTSDTITQTKTVQVDMNALKAEQIDVTLFGNTITISKDRVTTNDDYYTWFGSGDGINAVTVVVDIVKNMEFLKTVTIYTSDSAQASQTSSFGATKYGASNSVRIVYPLTSITDNIAIPVSVGDMIEYVIRVNLDAKGAPVPASDDGSYSSYVSVTTKFGGGVITVGMS